MSVPPQVMNMMNKGPQPGAGGPPVSAPMSTPQPNAGEKQSAMTQIQMAMDIMERTLPAFGMETEEGKLVHDVLGKMGKLFGGSQRMKSKELVPAEIMNLQASMPKPMGGPPGAGGPPGGGKPPMAPPMQ